MKPCLRVCTAWLLLFYGPLCGFGETQWIDMVHLRDGTSLEGVIVEQTAGESVRLAKSDKIVLTLPQREIESIEKVETRQAYPLVFEDVLILKDGVIFRGLLMEQRPDVEVVLQTHNGLRLGFAMEEIWKILKQKRLAGQPKEEAPAADDLKTIKLVLRIERGAEAIREKRGADRPEALEEELGELEREQSEAEQELAAEQTGTQRERIEETCAEIEELLQEFEQGLEACGESQALPAIWVSGASLGPSARRLREGIAELKGRIAAKLPSEEELRALEEVQRARATLEEWLAEGDWRNPFYLPKTRALAGKLPMEDRQFLYEANAKRTGWLGFGLNAIPVLQLGSWAQGDWLGALLGYAHFVGLLYAGLIMESAGLYYPPTPEWGVQGDPGWVTLGCMSVSYTLGLLQPLYYQSRWNQHLAKALQLPQEGVGRKTKQAALLPPAVVIRRTPEEGLAVNLRLVSLSY